MVDSVGLLKSGIYKVWDAWTGWKDLCSANHAAKASQKNIQFFCVVTPTELPSIMGLEGIHSLEALCRQGDCSHCPWCAKEGQNEGTMVNHLCTVYYYLGLVCSLCLACFTTSADTMRKHRAHCKDMAMGTGKRGRHWKRTVATKVMSTSPRKFNSITLHPPSHGGGGMDALNCLICSGHSYCFQYSYDF